MSPEILALAAALVAQVCGLVWGASQIANSVRALTKTVDKLDNTVEHLDKRVQDHETRVTVLEHMRRLDHRAKVS